MSPAAASAKWRPSPTTRVEIPGLCLMHGGPAAMYLPEHQHPELQFQANFLPSGNLPGAPLQEMPQAFRLIPPGQPHRGQWAQGTEVVVALISSSLFERGAGGLGQKSSFEFLPVSCGIDPLVQSLAGELRQAFHTGSIVDILWTEAVGIVLTGRLLQRWCSRTAQPIPNRRLSQADLRRVLNLIEENLASGLTIRMLADRIGLGAHRFTREFKAATGRTPHRFITEHRIAKARLLLEKTSLPLAEIALELGFVSQSHFTAVFRQHLQTTPQVYRHSRRTQ